MIPIAELPAQDIEYADEVIELSKRATAFLISRPWCREIVNGWLGWACGYIIGVFYFQLLPSRPEVPHNVWVIVGDNPPAYLSIEYAHDVSEALEGYTAEMQEWVDRVLEGRPLDGSVIPVDVPPERVWAERLGRRLDFIRKSIIPNVAFGMTRTGEGTT
jgi:hypothetical protein